VAADLAVTVTDVVATGNIEVTYKNPATREKVTVTIPVNADKTKPPVDTPASVAAKIAAALPGAVVDPKNPMRAIVPDAIARSIGGNDNGVIKVPPSLLSRRRHRRPKAMPEAMLFIDPALNGGRTLGVDAVLSAGYLNGNDLATYDAAAGQNIAQLTAGLDAAMMTDGYLVSDNTSLGEILVDAQNSGEPLDLGFALQAVGNGDPLLSAAVLAACQSLRACPNRGQRSWTRDATHLGYDSGHVLGRRWPLILRTPRGDAVL
jgi:hypothetical protein